MKTVLKAVAALLIAGANGYAQDFAGGDFYEGLQSAREELRAGASASAAPAAQPTPEGFPADAAAPAAEKEWTVMVFINGKNNLEGAGFDDINEMEKIGSGRDVNIVVEQGLMSSNRMSRLLVKRDRKPNEVTSPALGSARGVDMGDPASVRDFVLWAERRFPAKKYMLILWDHGSGWIKGNPAESRGDAKGVSDDWVSGHNIDTPQLGRLARDIEAAGGRVDLLAFDACLMQMAEVAYELKDSRISHIAASEEIEPGSGYPYDKWLARLAARPGMGAGELGAAVAQEYLKAYPDGFQGTGLTYSVVEVAKLRRLAERMDDLAKAALAAGDKAPVLRARAEATRYSYADNKDLRRFAQLLGQYSADARVKAAAAGVEALMGSGGPVIFSGVSANRRTLSSGVAAYVPENANDISGYSELKFSADTQWDEFVNWLLKP